RRSAAGRRCRAGHSGGPPPPPPPPRRKSAHPASPPPSDLLVEAQPAQLLGVALPVLGDLHPQVEVDAAAQQRFDLPACPGADLAQPGALRADDDRLLAG